jgi:guanylate kinase
VTKRRGLLIVISGPSGVGKDTLTHRLLKLDRTLRYSVSYTTRAKRPVEVDGKDYSFIGRAEFERLVAKGEFLEHATYDRQLYGTSAKRIEAARQEGRDIILKIEVKGAEQVRKKVRDAILIFLKPPSMEELVRRQKERRSESEADMEARRKIAEKELTYADRYDRVVVNDDIGRAVDEVQEIIKEARGRQT